MAETIAMIANAKKRQYPWSNIALIQERCKELEIFGSDLLALSSERLPVGSFARTSLSHSSLQRHAPRRVMCLSPKACSWSIPYSRAQLEFRKQTISACHRQLYTLQITASHRWKVLEHYLPPRRVFTFAGHRSKYIRERFHFRFRHPRTKSSVSSPTDKTNRKYRYIYAS